MAKIQLKSDNINPFGGLFSIFKQFDRSGLRQTIDSVLGKRGTTKAAFSYGDVFASLFGSYLCSGDCIEDLMDVKSFWDGRDKLRICSSDVALRTLRKLSCDNVTYKSTQDKSYDFNTNEKMNALLLKCLAVTGQQCGVTSFKFDSMLPDLNLRLVVQRTPVTDEDPDAEPEGIFGTEYVYRCIVTNDWDKSEREIICYYNKRGASERNFDCQNNDFGLAHLPFSFLKENTVFLIATAMLKNFYLYLLGILDGRVKGLDRTARLKRFLRCFVIVPAKWIKSGRRNVLNLYTKRRIYLELAC